MHSSQVKMTPNCDTFVVNKAEICGCLSLTYFHDCFRCVFCCYDERVLSQSH